MVHLESTVYPFLLGGDQALTTGIYVISNFVFINETIYAGGGWGMERRAVSATGPRWLRELAPH